MHRQSARRVWVCASVCVNGDRSLQIPRPLSVSTNHKAASAMWFNEPSCVRRWGLHFSRIKEEQNRRRRRCLTLGARRNSMSVPSLVLFFSPRLKQDLSSQVGLEWNLKRPAQLSLPWCHQWHASLPDLWARVRSCIAVALDCNCTAVTEILVRY